MKSTWIILVVVILIVIAGFSSGKKDPPARVAFAVKDLPMAMLIEIAAITVK